MPSSRSRTSGSTHSRVSSTLAILSLATELILAMRRAIRPPGEKAVWNDREVDLLLDYLVQHQSEGEGGSFKKATFNNCAEFLDSQNVRTAGPVKSATMCTTKWTGIKSIYQSIEAYRSTSGFSWDPVRGACIEDDASAKVWDVYTSRKENAGIKPFRNKGWPPYDKVLQIIPSQARGARIFRPSSALALDPALLDTVLTGHSLPNSGSPAPAAATCSSSDPATATVHTLGPAIAAQNSSSPVITVPPPPSDAITVHPCVTNQPSHTTLPSPPASSADSSASSTSSVSKRKRGNTSSLAPSKRAGSSQLSLSSKSSGGSRTRPSGSSTGGAIDALQGEVKKLSTVLSSVRFVPPAPTPQELELLKEALTSLDSPGLDLSVTEQVAVAKIFMRDPVSMRTFAFMGNDLVRKAFVKDMLGDTSQE